jgi:hypothetical protein
MVKHGIKGAVGGGAVTMQVGPITAYRDAAAQAGKHLELGADIQSTIWTSDPGSPGQLVDRLKGFEERYPGMQHISLSSPNGAPESIMLEQFQWLGEEVMPAFRTGRR